MTEIGEGDPEAAARRIALAQGLRRLNVTDTAIDLAEQIARHASLPAKAGVDALHVAVATTNGLDLLLTWNCRHIAGAKYRRRIELACRRAGFEPPTICTPLELMERT